MARMLMDVLTRQGNRLDSFADMSLRPSIAPSQVGSKSQTVSVVRAPMRVQKTEPVAKRPVSESELLIQDGVHKRPKSERNPFSRGNRDRPIATTSELPDRSPVIPLNAPSTNTFVAGGTCVKTQNPAYVPAPLLVIDSDPV